MENEEKEQLAIRREALKGYDNFLLSIGFFFTFVVLERGLFVMMLSSLPLAFILS